MQEHQLWTALVTPFDADGAFDLPSYRRLVEFQLASGVTGVVPCGSTGESPTLSWDEHNQAVEAAVQCAARASGPGKMRVMAGCGSNSTVEAIAATREAAARGADSALLMDCYYNGPSSLELRTEYYERVLAEVPRIPIVPYVIPGRTGCALEAEDLAILHLTDPVRVPAVKSATGDVERQRRDRALAGASLQILSGDDDLTYGMMVDPEIAACGAISVMSNILPGALLAMCAKASSEEGAAIAKDLSPVLGCVGVATGNERKLPSGRSVTVRDRFRNPTPIKTIMAGLGLIQVKARAPLGLMTARAVEHCREAVRAVHRARPGWFEPLDAFFGVDTKRRIEDDGVWVALARRE
jgi:4-hydroxy-tetrahydrodipicolinate synthase